MKGWDQIADDDRMKTTVLRLWGTEHLLCAATTAQAML